MTKEIIDDDLMSEEDLRKATIITEGKPSWSFRGYNSIFDKPAIEGSVKTDMKASRIFVTGEVHLDYVGHDACNLLLGINDIFSAQNVFIEPLFVETLRHTIRMTRFDPKFVWRCFHPLKLAELADEESKRIGIDMDAKTELECMDYYESIIHYMKKKNGDFCVPVSRTDMNMDFHFCVTYLTSLLLFNKPGYMGVHVADYFVDPVMLSYMGDMEYRTLSLKEQQEVNTLREKSGCLMSLTNDELLFLVSLYKD